MVARNTLGAAARRAAARTPVIAATIGLALASNASGQSLRDTLALTYEANPQLAAARADLRATDESLAQAKKNWFRPTLDATLSAQYEDIREAEFEGVAYTYSEKLKSYGAEVEATLPLYRGGRTLNSMRAARSGIESQESVLIETEQRVLSSAAVAYARVVLHDRLLELSLAQEKAYEPFLVMARNRLQSRTVTITDVSQVEANLADARATVFQQRGALRAAQTRYAAIVTELPRRLERAPSVPIRIDDLEQAVDVGLRQNPTILAAKSSLDQARSLVRVNKGVLLPSLDFTGLYSADRDKYRFSEAGYSDSINDNAVEAQVALNLTIPIFNGGYNYSRIRESIQAEQAAQSTLRRSQLSVRSRIEAAWYQRQAQAQRVAQLKDAVAAAETALDGKEHEYKDGTTTMTELLLVRRNLFLAQQMQAQAEYSYFAELVALLAAVGSFTAKALDLPVELYDPRRYLHEIEDRWIGYGVD